MGIMLLFLPLALSWHEMRLSGLSRSGRGFRPAAGWAWVLKVGGARESFAQERIVSFLHAAETSNMNTRGTVTSSS